MKRELYLKMKKGNIVAVTVVSGTRRLEGVKVIVKKMADLN